MTRKPPLKCEVLEWSGLSARRTSRCVNDGTHWHYYQGCGCKLKDPEICVDHFEVWECNGPHIFEEVSESGRA